MAALFITAPPQKKKWRQPNCPSPGELIHKIWLVYTMRYYSATQLEEVLIHSTTWRYVYIYPPTDTHTHTCTYLKNIMLNKRQT